MNHTLDLFAGVSSAEEPLLPLVLPQAPGFSACWDAGLQGFHIEVPDGELFYAEHFFSAAYADRCVAYFLENATVDARSADWRAIGGEALPAVGFAHIHWHQDSITLYGRQMSLPRFSAWHGDSDRPYTYSGITLQPGPWNAALLDIRARIAPVSGETFNSVLLNWYRDGNDHISWHTDAEPELGRNPVIASVNFGETRRFLLRRKDDHAIKLELPLRHGTLLVMKGALQHHWQHAVPKEARVKGNRFNLTFRTIR